MSLLLSQLTVKTVTVAFAGAGVLSTTPGRVRARSATFAGAGTLSATTVRVRSRTAAWSGAGTLLVTTTRVRQGSATFAGRGGFSAVVEVIHVQPAAAGGGGGPPPPARRRFVYDVFRSGRTVRQPATAAVLESPAPKNAV